MPGIFISYRRGDTAGYVDRIAEDLRKYFGEDSVFVDVSVMEPGVQFPSALQEFLAYCDAVLVVIGPGWLDARSDSGAKRLHSTHDYVRLEVETALARNVSVIPVLTGGACMPTKQVLPKSIRGLADLQALEVSRTHYESDIARLRLYLNKVVVPSADFLLCLLRRGEYDRAAERLRSLIRDHADHAPNHFFLALALLKGRRGKGLTLSEAREVEKHLRRAHDLDPERAEYSLVWAWLKWEFFVLNGFEEPEQVRDFLDSAIQAKCFDPGLIQAIIPLLASENDNPAANILKRYPRI